LPVQFLIIIIFLPSLVHDLQINQYLGHANRKLMRNTCFFIALLLFLASCDQVIFTEPQPTGVRPLDEIPAQFRGVYTDTDHDTLRVYDNSFLYTGNGLSGNQPVYLSDSAVIKEYRDRYFLNIRLQAGEDSYWLTYLLQSSFEGRRLEVYAMDPDNIVNLARLQEITSKIRDVSMGEHQYHLFSPRKRDYKKIIGDSIFSRMIRFDKTEALP